MHCPGSPRLSPSQVATKNSFHQERGMFAAEDLELCPFVGILPSAEGSCLAQGMLHPKDSPHPIVVNSG